jgi:hypothetical protein
VHLGDERKNTNINNRHVNSMQGHNVGINNRRQRQSYVSSPNADTRNVPVNDGTFTRNQFSGSLKDTNHVDKWLEHFTYYAEFRCISADRKLQLFKLLLTGQAAV